MTKIKGLITLFISLVFIVIGCGEPLRGYKIHRIDDTLLVFLAMKDKSKIVDTAIDNNKLHVDIDTGKQIEERVTSLQHNFNIKLIEPHETLEIQGTGRINGYGVVHITISSPRPRKFSMSLHLSISNGKGFSKKPGPFGNSDAFRVGDRITAYCFFPNAKKSSKKISKFGINFEVKRTPKTATTYNFEEKMLSIETYNPDTHQLIRKLSYPLDDLEPNETVEVEDREKLGEDIHIAYLKVVPKKNEPIKVVRKRSYPINDKFLTDR